MKTKINVEINKASLKAIAIELTDKLPVVEARLNLYAGEKRITTVSMGTQSWDEVKMDLPMSVIENIGKIVKVLEEVAKKAFMDSFKQLKSNNDVSEDA